MAESLPGKPVSLKRDKDTTRPIRILLALAGGQKARADLAREFECNERTIERNIRSLLDAGFDIDTDYGQDNKAFYVLNDERHLDSLFGFTPVELVSLLAARSAFTTYHFNALGMAFENILERITRHLPEPTREFLEKHQEHLVFQGSKQKLTEKQKEMLELVLDAITRKLRLQISYTDARGEESLRTISPIQILHTPDRIYIVSFCHKRDETRHFALDRIHKMELTLERSYIPPDFNLHIYLSRAMVAYVSDTTTLCRVKVWGKALENAKANEYHRSQKLQIAKDGETALFSLQVSGLQEVKNLVMTWGREAEVLEPPELLQMVIDEYQGVCGIYGIKCE